MQCKKLHSFVCPSFAVTGQCSRGDSCSLLHRRIRKQQVGKLSKGSTTYLTQRCPEGKQSSEVSARSGVASRQHEGSSLEPDRSVASDDIQPRLLIQTSNEVLQQPEATFSSEAKQEQSEDIRNDLHLSESLTSTIVASPKRGSAPLSSQPSFISLPLDSPAIAKVPVSVSGFARESGSGLSIKPLFVAQKLHEQLQEKSKLSNDTNEDNLRPYKMDKSCKPVPTPAFLSSKISKESSKQ
ncbi:hypothetical protein ElyMa_000626600 [Elysia marginata]|uniref:C3H1-type domain-containing protein n=1 Tax=Elysia marginata TaxID=1093978 RepID=A0AAV4G9M9_9GAST|nr:hypothetical protein ElyMa_000626600 [Elysia marginata]